MKFRIMIYFLVLPFVSFSQKPFTIKGFGAGFKNGDKIFLSFKGAKGWTDDSVIVEKNRFRFDGNVKNIIRANVYRNQNPKYANIIYDYATVYLEEGQISMNSADTLFHSINSGTQTNNDYKELLASIRPLIDRRKLMRSPADLSKTELEDSLLVSGLSKAWKDIGDSIVPIKFDFINKHPKSFVSLETLSELIRESRWLPLVESSFGKLSITLRTSELGKSVNDKILDGKKTGIGVKAKDFNLIGKNGENIQLSDYRGKYLLLDFWASWCNPCRAENPNIRLAYQKFKNKGFKVLSVSIDTEEDKQKWLKAILEDKMIWDQVIDIAGEYNVAKKIYGVTTIPANLLIDPSGIIVSKDLKGGALQAKLIEIYK